MSKRLLLLFLLLKIGLSVFPQQRKADSLRAILKNAKEDTTCVNLLNQLSNTLLNLGEYDHGLVYGQRAKKLAEQLHFQSGLASSLGSMGTVYWRQGNFLDAMDCNIKALKIREGIGNKRAATWSLSNIGGIYASQGNFPKALEFHEKALKLEEEIGDQEGVGYSLCNLALVFFQQGNYPKALDFNLKALHIIEKNNDQVSIATCLSNIGNVYLTENDFQQALAYYNKAELIQREMDDKAGISNTLLTMGLVYFNMGDCVKSLDYQQKALALKEEIGEKEGISACLGNIGSIFEKQGDYTKALDYYEKSRVILIETGDRKSQSTNLCNIGSIYQAQKKYDLAKKYMLEGLTLAEETGSLDDVKNAHEALSQIYFNLHDGMSALDQYKKFITARDSIFNKENTRKLTQTEMNFDFDKKMSLQKAAEEKRELLNQSQTRQQKLLIVFTVIGLLLVMVFAIFVVNRLRVTRRQKETIELQKKIVDEKNKDITDSIHYAQKIQQAILPPSELQKTLFLDSFILFKPKDIVSGDFYWFSEKKGVRLVAAVDCTGHGVPGAFMSMIGNVFLNEIVNERGITQPATILNELREMIIKSLKQTGAEGENKDGMDISLVALSADGKKLQFAGANNPLWHYRREKESWKLSEIKGDKQPIGFYRGNPLPFTNHEVEMQAGDSFYLFSDGFADQFGGDKGKKFKYKPFQQLLQGLQDFPMDNQLSALLSSFNAWKRHYEQVDDLLIIGIRPTV
jgi:tetratricopeptide (TPR) repeat protein